MTLYETFSFILSLLAMSFGDCTEQKGWDKEGGWDRDAPKGCKQRCCVWAQFSNVLVSTGKEMEALQAEVVCFLSPFMPKGQACFSSIFQVGIS